MGFTILFREKVLVIAAKRDSWQNFLGFSIRNSSKKVCFMQEEKLFKVIKHEVHNRMVHHAY
jgi:hypothetical protein